MRGLGRQQKPSGATAGSDSFLLATPDSSTAKCPAIMVIKYAWIGASPAISTERALVTFCMHLRCKAVKDHMQIPRLSPGVAQCAYPSVPTTFTIKIKIMGEGRHCV